MSTTSYTQFAVLKNNELAHNLGWRYISCSDTNPYVKAWRSANGKWQEDPQWAQQNGAAFSLMLEYECFPVVPVDSNTVCVATGLEENAYIFAYLSEHPGRDAALRIAIIDAVLAKIKNRKKLTYSTPQSFEATGLSEIEVQYLLNKFMRGELTVPSAEEYGFWSDMDSLALKETLTRIFIAGPRK